MKKPYLLFVITIQLFFPCALRSEPYSGKIANQSFTHLDKDQPKLTSNKRVSPSESSYPGADGKKYILKNPELPEENEVNNKIDLEIPNIESSILNEPSDNEEGKEVISPPLEEELKVTPEEGNAEEVKPSDPVKNNENQKYEGYYKVGNPYKIAGITYYPEKYDNFEEVGLASWYGSEFHGKSTANGETYDMKDFTAAHRTLPLPSIVKITNLENGKSVIVRVNDRGPFASNRVIDVSEKAADKFGFKGKGTTTVKVQFLKKETKVLLIKINKERKEQEQNDQLQK